VTETVTGPLTWLPGDPGEDLRLVSSLSGAGQVFFASQTGGATPINVNLNAVAPAPTRFEGQGTFQETLIFLGGDTLSGDPLSGRFTYTFTPFAIPPLPPGVPEPSTWAMMLIGFAGLGLRRGSAQGHRARDFGLSNQSARRLPQRAAHP
jgi:PEP-CTERM motif